MVWGGWAGPTMWYGVWDHGRVGLSQAWCQAWHGAGHINGRRHGRGWAQARQHGGGTPNAAGSGVNLSRGGPVRSRCVFFPCPTFPTFQPNTQTTPARQRPPSHPPPTPILPTLVPCNPPGGGWARCPVSVWRFGGGAGIRSGMALGVRVRRQASCHGVIMAIVFVPGSRQLPTQWCRPGKTLAQNGWWRFGYTGGETCLV